MNSKNVVIKKYPNAYCTFGIQMFSNKKVFRIEDGNGNILASNSKTEVSAWTKAAKVLSNKTKVVSRSLPVFDPLVQPKTN